MDRHIGRLTTIISVDIISGNWEQIVVKEGKEKCPATESDSKASGWHKISKQLISVFSVCFSRFYFYFRKKFNKIHFKIQTMMIWPLAADCTCEGRLHCNKKLLRWRNIPIKLTYLVIHWISCIWIITHYLSNFISSDIRGEWLSK